MLQEIYSWLAIILTFVGFYPYISSILKGQTKPHVFSWVIWGISTSVVYFAQVEDGGGMGAYSTGISALITLYIAYLAYRKKTDSQIKPLDWICFVVALASIPLWYITQSPLWAVIILTSIDTIGFIPTVRKAYAEPLDESPLFYGMFAFRNIFAILALEHLSVTTILFPLVTGFFCIPLIVIIFVRRKALRKTKGI